LLLTRWAQAKLSASYDSVCFAIPIVVALLLSKYDAIEPINWRQLISFSGPAGIDTHICSLTSTGTSNNDWLVCSSVGLVEYINCGSDQRFGNRSQRARHSYS